MKCQALLRSQQLSLNTPMTDDFQYSLSCFIFFFFCIFPNVSNLALAAEVMADILGVVLCGEMHTSQIFLNLKMI